jgi:hypothetical protein
MNHKKMNQIWSVISLIFGFASIIPIMVLFITKFLSIKIIPFSVVGIFGIFAGIKGLNSSLKIVAIIGLIFSIVGVIAFILLNIVKLGFELEG